MCVCVYGFMSCNAVLNAENSTPALLVFLFSPDICERLISASFAAFSFSLSPSLCLPACLSRL